MPAQVVDLFCGVGGLSRGLQQAGLNVVAGFDLDETCHYTYEYNNKIPFHQGDIRKVTENDINACYANDALKVLVGCAPCQPFSQMSTKLGNSVREDEKYGLLLEFGRLIKDVRPVIVSMENVPRIRKTDIFDEFINTLREEGYYTDGGNVVYCPKYGIAQNRHRFVLLASKLGEIQLLPPTHTKKYVTVRQVIGELPHVEAGKICPTDPMHITAKLSDKNLKRIQASVPGGSWRDWPEDLRCSCHRKKTGQTYTSVYGRMKWDTIGPTMTTQFFCYGTGRYGHPEQDRALTLREGALLQTFPINYDFINPNVPFSIRNIARHIGNAVPVRLGEVIGQSILRHLENNNVNN